MKNDKDLNARCVDLSREIVKIMIIELRKRGAGKEMVDNVLRHGWPKIQHVIDSMREVILDTALKEEDRVARARDEAKYEKLRIDYLGRILINEIEDRLPGLDDFELAEKVCREFVDNVIPRTVISGLLSAVKDMFGHDYIASKEKICKEVANNHRKEDSRIVDWAAVCDDPKVREVVTEILSLVRNRLDKGGDQIKNWFITRIISSKTFVADMGRDFTDDDYRLLLASLFRRLDTPKQQAS